MDPPDKSEPNLPPKGLNGPVRLIAVSLEALLEKAIRKVEKWLGRVDLPLAIEQHNVLAIPAGVVVQGRVLATKVIRQPRLGDSAWVNLSRMLQLWMTDEEPYAKVEALCGGILKESNADEEGYFEITFDHAAARGATAVELRLPQSRTGKWRELPVLAPAEDFEFLVISDIDDTILETNVESLVKLFKTMFLGNVLTRSVFRGTSDFFQRLTENGNPVFFVSSSPWNLRGFIQSVFDRHQIPRGVFFMTDWGLDSEKWFSKSHITHKTESIERILNWYPDKKAILIGDTSQKDPEIYAELAEKYPRQIGVILIRNVSRGKRRENQVEVIAQKARKSGIVFRLCASSTEMDEEFCRERKTLKSDRVR